MAHIAKVATGNPERPYEVRWSWYDADGARHFKKERFRTRREAEARRRAAEDAVAAATLPDYSGGRDAVAAWGERWLSTKRATWKPNTRREYERIWVASVVPAFGARRVRAVTTADVQAWADGLLARGLSPHSVKRHVTVLSKVLGAAVRARALPANPVADVELPSDRAVGRLPYEPYFLTAEQVEDVAAGLPAPYDLLVRFVAWTGLRAGEVSGLNVGDVDLLRRAVSVRRTARKVGAEWEIATPKSGKARRVPLMPWLAEDLHRYLSQHPQAADPDAPLWPGARPGGGGAAGHCPVDYARRWEAQTFYRRRYLPAVRAAGLPTGRGGVNFHSLRHSFASLAASRGVSARQVAAWMGHASEIVTVTIYTHLFTADTDAAVAAMAGTGRPTPSADALATVTALPTGRPSRATGGGA